MMVRLSALLSRLIINALRKAGIPRRRHRHRHPRRHPHEDRRENVGVSFRLPQELQEIARVRHVGEDPREDVRVGVGVGVAVVEF